MGLNPARAHRIGEQPSTGRGCGLRSSVRPAPNGPMPKVVDWCWSRLEAHLDHGGALDEVFHVRLRPVPGDLVVGLGEESASECAVGDRMGGRRVAVAECVDGEPWVGLEVGQPIPRSGGSCDDEQVVDAEPPDLDADRCPLRCPVVVISMVLVAARRSTTGLGMPRP